LLSDEIDIVFAVDATSSMGDEIAFLKDDLMNIILDVKTNNPGSEVNLGSLFYQCFGSGNEYVTVASDLTSDLTKTLSFIRGKKANGGGDEVVDVALDEAINKLSWRPGAKTKLLFILLDEPPSNTAKIAANMLKVCSDAAAKGIKIIPCISSNYNMNSNRSLEYLMRNAAIATNGTLIFLTNDSGVGGEHTIPFTDHYEVELFRDALIRIIRQYSEKAVCETNETVEIVRAEVVQNNGEEKVNQLLDSIAMIQNDSSVAAVLLPFSGFKTSEELLAAKPLTAIDTTRFLNSFEVRTEELVIFPNPTFGELTIKTSAPCSYAEVLDANGRLLIRQTLNGETAFKVSISDFPSGGYYVRCKVAEVVLEAKLRKI